MAEVVIGPVLKQFYAVSLELLRRKTVESVEDGDVSLGDLRNMLMTEFELIHQSLNLLRMEPLETAISNVKSAVNAFDHGLQARAVELFKTAEQDAKRAFTTAVSFESKAMSVRIRVLCVLFEHGYFTRAAIGESAAGAAAGAADAMSVAVPCHRRGHGRGAGVLHCRRVQRDIRRLRAHGGGSQPSFHHRLSIAVQLPGGQR